LTPCGRVTTRRPDYDSSYVDPHRLAEERSIALHRAIGERVRSHPELLMRAKARVSGWIERGEPHAFYAREWARILELPLDEMLAALVDTSENARALRQVTPFAGALGPRERWTIWREVGRSHGL
jgi:hypothetical protein